jgi:dTDP-4-dehydrorhamnose reductase
VRILVTGANGQLGWDVAKRLAPEHEVVRFDKEHMDPSPSRRCRLLKGGADRSLGAYTAVDRAEEERELCHSINAEATRAIAAQAVESGARLIYVSTDYVFDGTKSEPYETDDPPHPINYYGQTKLEGELAVRELMKRYQIVRTS